MMWYMRAAIVVVPLTLLIGLWVRPRRAVIYSVIVGGLVGGLYALGGVDALKIAGAIVWVPWLPLWFFLMVLPLGIIKGMKEKQTSEFSCEWGCYIRPDGQIQVMDDCEVHNRL